jgi:hypothetical protein
LKNFIEARTQAYALWVHKTLRRDLAAVVQAYALDIKNYERQTDAADAARAAAAVWATAPANFPALDLEQPTPDPQPEPDPTTTTPDLELPDPDPTPPVDTALQPEPPADTVPASQPESGVDPEPNPEPKS